MLHGKRERELLLQHGLLFGGKSAGFNRCGQGILATWLSREQRPLAQAREKIDASSFGSKTAPGTYFVAWINSRDKFPRHHVGQYRVSFPFSNDHQYFYWIDPDDRMSLEDLIALLNEKTTSEQDGCSEREGRR